MKYLFRDNCVGISIFRQAGVAPSITLVSIANITDNSATANVSIADGDDVSKTGVQVDTDPTFSNPTSYEQNGAVNSIAIDNLTAETTYYVRGYVIWSGQTIYSSNSLNFTTQSGSILPSALQACEYLEADGASYIILPYYNRSDIDVSVKISCSNDNCLIFGARQSISAGNYYIQNYLTYKRIGYGGGADTINTKETNYIFEKSGNDLYIRYFDGTIIHKITKAVSFSYSTNMIAFGANLPATAISLAGTKIYEYTIQNNRNVACYIKAGQTFIDNKGNTCTAGTRGMFDIVNQIFYTNDGPGTFGKGADINI